MHTHDRYEYLGFQRKPAMYKSITAITACLLMCLSLAACSSRPYVDYDTDFDFANAQRYFIIPTEISDQPIMGPRVAAAIDGDLSDKGLSPARSRADADIAITYSVTAAEKPNTSRVSIGLGTGSYGGRGGASVGGSVSKPIGADMLLYNTIQIDMYPADSERLVWRSSDSFEIKGADAQKIAQAAQKLVTRILADFPPKP